MDNWDDATQRGQKPWKTLGRLHTAFTHFAPIDHSIQIYLIVTTDGSTKAAALHRLIYKNLTDSLESQHTRAPGTLS